MEAEGKDAEKDDETPSAAADSTGKENAAATADSHSNNDEEWDSKSGTQTFEWLEHLLSIRLSFL